jgi:hypothetical protein
MIRVEASGQWTARLYMDGFSFNSLAFPNPRVTTLTTPQAIDGNGFYVYTHSRNEEDRPRSAFIVVTLDKDPDNYVSVVRLSQLNAGAVKLMPDDQTAVVFDGAGALKVIPGASNVNTFTVNPGQIDGSSPPAFYSWSAQIIQTGIYDDRGKFQILDRTNTVVGDDSPALYDAYVDVNNVVKVQSIGINTTGRELRAILRIYKDMSTYTDILLIQEPVEWNIVATGLTAIPAAGGMSVNIGVNAPSSMHFTATILSPTPNTLSNHWACLVDMANSDAKVNTMTNRPASETFKVYYPKLIWPNVGVSPQVVVEVKMVESGEVKTITISQSAIPQHVVNIFSYSASWSQITYTSGAPWSPYNQFYVDYLLRSNNNMYGPSGTVRTAGGPRIAAATAYNNVASIGAGIRMVHFARPVRFNSGSNAAVLITNGQNATNWINGGDNGVLVIGHEESGSNATDGFGPDYLPGRIYNSLGLTGGGSNNDDYRIWNEPSHRIIRYLTAEAPWALTAPSTVEWFGNTRNSVLVTAGVTSWMNTSTVFGIDNINPSNLSTIHRGAIPVLHNTSTGRSVIMIDPKRNVVVLNDSEMFQSTSGYSPSAGAFGSQPNPTGFRGRFTANLLAYIVNNAQYGSFFSDYFWDSPRYLETPPAP